MGNDHALEEFPPPLIPSGTAVAVILVFDQRRVKYTQMSSLQNTIAKCHSLYVIISEKGGGDQGID